MRRASRARSASVTCARSPLERISAVAATLRPRRPSATARAQAASSEPLGGRPGARYATWASRRRSPRAEQGRGEPGGAGGAGWHGASRGGALGR